MPKNSRIAVILPAYNEALVIGRTIATIKTTLAQEKINATLIVIDDGSDDQTAAIAKKAADIILRHRLNRGLGASLITGIEYVRRQKYFTHLVTFDSDGQHDASDIPKAIKILDRGYDVVIGSRFLNPHQQFPKLRKFILQVSNFITYLFFHVRSTDSQSGFRALGQKAIASIQLTANRMEVSSEFFAEIKRLKLRFTEMPISVRYTDYSLQKGQANIHGFRVLLKLLYKLFQ